MQSLLSHMAWVSTQTAFFPPEMFTPNERRFEEWHLPFFKTLPLDVSPAEAISLFTEMGLWVGDIQMLLYWWWVYREMIKTPFSATDTDAIETYMQVASDNSLPLKT